MLNLKELNELKKILDEKGKELLSACEDHRKKADEINKEYDLKAADTKVSDDELAELEDKAFFHHEEADILEEKVELITDALRSVVELEENLFDLEAFGLL